MNLDLAYRSLVLKVAGSPQVEALIRRRARGLVRRYVAGESLEEALRAAEALEGEGVHAILEAVVKPLHGQLRGPGQPLHQQA